MKRAFQVFVGLAAVLLVATGAVYGVRVWRARIGAAPDRAAMSASMPGPGAPTAPAADRAAAPATTARGEVTIDPRRQQLIGVRTVPVTRAAVTRTVRAVGAVRYDETRQADVNVKVEGWIRDLYVDYTGQAIRAGQPLFTLYSPDLLTTENEFLLALKTRDQMQQSMIPDARERAEALVASARQRLLLWDLTAEQVRDLETRRQASEALVFRAPVSGFVLEKQAVKGLHVMPGQSLYKVADVGSVWVEADVYENELADVRIGAPAAVTVDAYPGQRFNGRAIYIYPYLDEKTRTNKVRFAFANAGGRLKPGMFANVELQTRGGTGLLVPMNAVLDSGTEQLVFVAQGDGMFEPRKVKVGRRLTDTIEILDGVKDGEQVATGATFFLDSESQLRASLQGYEAQPTPSGGGTGSPGAVARLDITLRTIPDPAKTGDNQFEVVVKDASGKSIDDAEVSVQLLMPAMPTMNMPAMRNDVTLTPAGGGVYRGSGEIMMTGRWDATVTVTRGGQRLASTQVAVVAR
jgi:RND family efflux transporter MFP subunit